jgi:hypothetical protein
LGQFAAKAAGVGPKNPLFGLIITHTRGQSTTTLRSSWAWGVHRRRRSMPVGRRLVEADPAARRIARDAELAPRWPHEPCPPRSEQFRGRALGTAVPARPCRGSTTGLRSCQPTKRSAT